MSRGIVRDTDKLSPAQEKYVNYLVQGLTQRQAYKKAYPNSRLKDSTIDVYASRIIGIPKVYNRYTELLNELREREKTKTGWTREQSIEALRFIIDTNKKDLERIQQAAEEELIELQKAIKEHPEDADKLIQLAIIQRKRTRANKTNNDGVISAVSELNKMLGFNEQNVNMSGTVVFSGDDELLD